MSAWRHVRAIALLPGFVAVAGPAVMVWRSGASVGWGLARAAAVVPVALGVVVMAGIFLGVNALYVPPS